MRIISPHQRSRRDLPIPLRLKTASLQPSLRQWMPILTLRQKQLHHSRLPLPTSQRNFPLPLNEQLANLVNELCKDHLPKAKLDAVLEQYHRPSNCDHLVSPKVNKVVWQQLNHAGRTADNAMQRCQKLFSASVYAMLHACTQTPRAARPSFIHEIERFQRGNRDINLRRREFLRPHLNFRYSALCNPSTPITSEIFGDDINKEIHQLTKSSQLGTKLTNFRRARGSRFHQYAAATSRNFTRPTESRTTPRSFQAFFGSTGSYRRRSGTKVGATQSRKPKQ